MANYDPYYDPGTGYGYNDRRYLPTQPDYGSDVITPYNAPPGYYSGGGNFAPNGATQGGAPQYDPSNPAPYINYFYRQTYGQDAPPDQIQYWSGKLASGETMGNGQKATPDYWMMRLQNPNYDAGNQGGFGSLGTLQNYLQAFQYPSFSAPGSFSFQPTPGFSPFSYDPLKTPSPFGAPTGADMSNDPGYQFRLKQGLDSIEASASARGVLNSGNTLQDVENYAQDYASNEFQNVYNRAFNTWQGNTGTDLAAQQQQYGQAAGAYGQNVDTALRQNQQAYDQALQGYQTNFGNSLQSYLTNYGTYTGLAGLGLNAYNTAGNLGLGYGNLGVSQGYLGLAQNQQPFNQLYSLAQLGYGATNSLTGQGIDLASIYGNQATGAGNFYGNSYTGAGNANAAGQVGSANAWNGGVAGIANGFNLGLYGAYYGGGQRQSTSSPTTQGPVAPPSSSYQNPYYTSGMVPDYIAGRRPYTRSGQLSPVG